MRRLLFSTVALAALMSAPIAMADPNDNPKHDAAQPDRGDNDRGNNADRDNSPKGGAMSGPGMTGGPNANDNRDNDKTIIRGNNDKTVIHDNDKTVIHDNDRTVNKTVVHKTVDRSTVLKVRANIRAPHRFKAPKIYVKPAGWYSHRWVYGERLPRAFFAPDYFILDFAAFGLISPWDGYEWVRYGDDALLIDVETGEVIRVEYDVFY
jgi:Ni/Co efflux regulator RcnB